MEHNKGDSSWTSRYGKWILIHKNNHYSRSKAIEEEKFIKSLKNKERIKEYIAGWWSSTM